MENIIKTENLKIGYDGLIIVPKFNCEIKKHCITSIIGPNGCGKSTVLKAIGRIIPHEAGTIIINDVEMKNLKTLQIAKMMAILPQSPTAPSSITVFDLVSYGRYPYQKGLGKLSKEDKEIINWALNATHMEEYKNRAICNLSGGQRQRVWIAMALAQQTEIILLDEPTTYLDLNHQLEILELLKELNQKNKTTIVMVLHDLNLASKYSDYLLAMKDGEIVRYGTPKEVFNKEMLENCFQINGEIFIDQKSDKPLCVSYELLRKKGDNDEK